MGLHLVFSFLFFFLFLLLEQNHVLVDGKKIHDEEFDQALGETAVWLSATAYCDVNTFLIRDYEGPAKGFKAVDTICYSDYDVQGIIGVMESTKNIFIIFRGSSSLGDWINDFDIMLTPYLYCKDCTVHEGFYHATQYVLPPILETIQGLLLKYPSYNIIVTGHSLGAAMAALTALEIIQLFKDSSSILYKLYHTDRHVRLMNFGSPRVGNKEFAIYATEQLQAAASTSTSSWLSSIIFSVFGWKEKERNEEEAVGRGIYRVTHGRDMVPHLPWHGSFQHIAGEWFQDEDVNIPRRCVGYEDEQCAYHYYYVNIEDHMQYLGLDIGCDAVTSLEQRNTLHKRMQMMNSEPKKCNYGQKKYTPPPPANK